MKLPHALWALQSPKHASKVVNGLEDMTWRSIVSIPSTPQNLSAVADGTAVEEVEVVNEIEIEDAEESLDNNSLDEVLVAIELVSVEIEVEIKTVPLELKLLEL